MKFKVIYEKCNGSTIGYCGSNTTTVVYSEETKKYYEIKVVSGYENYSNISEIEAPDLENLPEQYNKSFGDRYEWLTHGESKIIDVDLTKYILTWAGEDLQKAKIEERKKSINLRVQSLFRKIMERTDLTEAEEECAKRIIEDARKTFQNLELTNAAATGGGYQQYFNSWVDIANKLPEIVKGKAFALVNEWRVDMSTRRQSVFDRTLHERGSSWVLPTGQERGEWASNVYEVYTIAKETVLPNGEIYCGSISYGSARAEDIIKTKDGKIEVRKRGNSQLGFISERYDLKTGEVNEEIAEINMVSKEQRNKYSDVYKALDTCSDTRFLVKEYEDEKNGEISIAKLYRANGEKVDNGGPEYNCYTGYYDIPNNRVYYMTCYDGKYIRYSEWDEETEDYEEYEDFDTSCMIIRYDANGGSQELFDLKELTFFDSNLEHEKLQKLYDFVMPEIVGLIESFIKENSEIDKDTLVQYINSNKNEIMQKYDDKYISPEGIYDIIKETEFPNGYKYCGSITKGDNNEYVYDIVKNPEGYFLEVYPDGYGIGILPIKRYDFYTGEEVEKLNPINTTAKEMREEIPEIYDDFDKCTKIISVPSIEMRPQKAWDTSMKAILYRETGEVVCDNDPERDFKTGWYRIPNNRMYYETLYDKESVWNEEKKKWEKVESCKFSRYSSEGVREELFDLKDLNIFNKSIQYKELQELYGIVMPELVGLIESFIKENEKIEKNSLVQHINSHINDIILQYTNSYTDSEEYQYVIGSLSNKVKKNPGFENTQYKSTRKQKEEKLAKLQKENADLDATIGKAEELDEKLNRKEKKNDEDDSNEEK